MTQQVTLTNNERVKEVLKCGKDVEYFINTYVKIQHPVKGLIPFNTFKYQDDCLESFINHRFNIVLKSRQLGLSTISAAYVLWLAIFHREKNILCIATKLSTATNFIKKVKVMWQSLPPWLKLTKEASISKSEIVFTNGSQIKAVPTSEDAGRSEALSLLVVDECVTGDTLISIRDSETGEEFQIAIEHFFALLQEENLDKNTVQVYI